MATTPPTRVTQLARSHRLDIDTGTYPTVSYEQLFGLEDLKLIDTLDVERDDGYTDAGAHRETNIGYEWRVEGKLMFSSNLAQSALDSVHSFLRTRFVAHRSGRVEANEFGIRFYHRDGLDDKYSAEGRVYLKEWTPPGGKGRQVIDFVMMGQGPLTAITNPAADLTPVVSSILPTSGGTAGGELVNIYGTHFSTATDVDFGADAATEFTVIHDSLIVAISPAVSASTVQVSVTNPTGTSANTSADDYTFA